jgi:excisionase family DNA binding protein
MKRKVKAAELAEFLGVQTATIWRWVRNGLLPHARVGSRPILFDLAEVEAFLHRAACKPARNGSKPSKASGR